MVGVLEYRTLRDYASTYTLHVDCPACHHHAVLNPLAAAQRVGWDVSLLDLKAGLRCLVCGHRGAEVRIVSDGRPVQAVARPLTQPDS